MNTGSALLSSIAASAVLTVSRAAAAGPAGGEARTDLDCARDAVEEGV